MESKPNSLNSRLTSKHFDSQTLFRYRAALDFHSIPHYGFIPERRQLTNQATGEDRMRARTGGISPMILGLTVYAAN
jgi:hypothetical protein